MILFLCFIIVLLLFRVIYLVECNRCLEYDISQLYQHSVGRLTKGNNMPSDPDAQIDAVSAFIDTEVASIATLTTQLAVAIAAQGQTPSDTAAADVQAKLDALTAKIAAIQSQSPTSTPVTPAPTS